MYQVKSYVINQNNALFGYCDKLTFLSNNLYNSSLFRIRQMLTYFSKDIPTPNEEEVMKEIKAALPGMNRIREEANLKREIKAKERNKEYAVSKAFTMPSKNKNLLNFSFLDALMKETCNPDYFSELPRHSAQGAIKQACLDVRNYFKALKVYKKDPSKFKEKPNLPHYKKSGGHCLVTLSNQECYIYDNYLKLPKTKDILTLGPVISDNVRLKQVEILPYYDCYRIVLVLENDIKEKEISEEPKRIAAIDFGVTNIAAIANNAGLPGLLFKGGILKSENKLYNKRRARILHGMTVGHPTESNPTSKSLYRLSKHRNGFMNTEMHTIAKKIVAWCIENNIDTLVLGHDTEWKQEVTMGKESNQKFVYIPFSKLRWCLTYMCQQSGIRIIDQEESYTSKASFLDMDDIPVYGEENGIKPEFSGYRKKRGLYKSKKHKRIINADLNAAGNILRKAFPNAFLGHTSYEFLERVYVM